MICSIRTLSRALFACVFFVGLTGGLRAQGSTNTYGPPGQNWPDNPPVGIGTVGIGTPQNALQIHHDPSNGLTWPAILRLSDGAADSINIFATLALMPTTAGFPLSSYSSIAVANDVVLHENIGDLILADLDPQPAAIRMTTTPDPTTLPMSGPLVPAPYTDLERETILNNGNIGFDLPPGLGGLCAPMDQIQIGGGEVQYPGNRFPSPPLTIYGGNRFEGMKRPSPDTGYFPDDWRGIALNHYEDHLTGIGYRFQPVSGSGIGFSEADSGLITLSVYPYDTSRAMTDFTRNVTLQMTGNNGLGMWYYAGPSDVYHHLFDVYLPGVLPWGMTRNTNGAFIHNTPVYITSDSSGHPLADFMNLTNVDPDIGDGKTWMLAVNGAALFKEAWVNSSDWPDYVFLPDYHLMTIEEFGNFMVRNHHLPEIPSATQMQTIPLGKTESAMTKQMEEMALY